MYYVMFSLHNIFKGYQMLSAWRNNYINVNISKSHLTIFASCNLIYRNRHERRHSIFNFNIIIHYLIPELAIFKRSLC